MAARLDRDRGARLALRHILGRGLVRVVEQAERRHRDHDQDQDRDDRPDHLDQRVVRRLGRRRVGARIVAHDHPQQQDQHERRDAEDDVEQQVVEAVDAIHKRRRRFLEIELPLARLIGQCCADPCPQEENKGGHRRRRFPDRHARYPARLVPRKTLAARRL
jgi:hypothetical protein